MYFDMAALRGRDSYKLMTATVVPRPIAWVVTQDAQGRANAAPFSFFGVMSGTPPIVAFGVGQSAGRMKDTAANIVQGSGEFVVNLVSQAQIEQMNVTAIEFDAGIDELAEAGLQTLPSEQVAPPRIAGSPVAMECRKLQVIELAPSQHMIVGRVLALHVADEAVLDAERCYIDTPRLDLVGRMHGAGGYSRQRDIFEVKRLTVADWEAKRNQA